MRSVLSISLALNLALLGLLVLLLAKRHAEEARAASPEIKPAEPAAAVTAAPEPPKLEVQPFRWSQLLSTNDYRVFVANLRAIGCPEATIEDIVRGNVDRVFAYERNQLRLDNSGDGPWSPAEADQLTARLLTAPTDNRLAATSLDAENGRRGKSRDGVVDPAASAPDTVTVAHPLFLQNVNWSALGFSADQQGVIAQVRQQFQLEVSASSQDSNPSANQNSSDSVSSSAKRQQQALQNADNQLRDLLGAQGYAAYEQQAYYDWYQPQVMAAAAGSGNLVINPGAFIPK